MSDMGGGMDGGGETGTVEIPEAANDNIPAGGDAPVADDIAETGEATSLPEAANDNVPQAANDDTVDDEDADDSSAEHGEDDGEDSYEPAGAVGPADADGDDDREPANDDEDDISKLASLAQASRDNKYQIDDWEAEVLPAGTIVYVGEPGPGDFYVSQETAQGYEGDAAAYNRDVQVAPYRGKGESEPTYREHLRAYRLTEDTVVAKGTAEASTQWGRGGGAQYFAPNLRANAERVPEADITMSNRSAVQLVVDNDT